MAASKSTRITVDSVVRKLSRNAACIQTFKVWSHSRHGQTCDIAAVGNQYILGMYWTSVGKTIRHVVICIE